MTKTVIVAAVDFIKNVSRIPLEFQYTVVSECLTLGILSQDVRVEFFLFVKFSDPLRAEL